MAIKLKSNDGAYVFDSLKNLSIQTNWQDNIKVDVWTVECRLTGAFAVLDADLSTLESSGMLNDKTWQLVDDGVPTVLREMDATAMVAGYPIVRGFVLNQRSTDGSWREELHISLRVEGRSKIRSSDTIFWQESITAVDQFLKVVPRTILGGSLNPVLQTTSLSPAFITQQGQAIGLTAHPSFPARLMFGTPAQPDQRLRETPKIGVDGDYSEYKITWNYTDVFSSTPVMPTPGVPPA